MSVNADWAAYAATQNGGNGLVWKEPKPAPSAPAQATVPEAAGHFFYWQDWNTPSRSYQWILSNGDGECGGWANFWKQELLVQGITEVTPTIVVIEAPPGISGMLINNWSFVPAVLGRSGDQNYPYLNTFNASPIQSSPTVLADNRYNFATADVSDVAGVSGQGNSNPLANFGQHVVVKLNSLIYDPSYGKTYTSLLQWQDASVAGFYIQSAPAPLAPLEWKIRKETPGVLEVQTLPKGQLP